jgi:hypothetical protein
MYSGVQPAAPVFEEAVVEEPIANAEPVQPEPEDADENRPGPRGQRLRLKRSASLDAPLG